MKKLLSIFILLAILILGVTAAFSYKVPEVKTYLTLNDIDQEIEQHLTVNEHSINETLTSLYNKVNQLMTVGETYTEGTDTTTVMEEFNTVINSLIEKYPEDEFNANWQPRIIQITDKYLGRGMKVSQISREQTEALSLIVEDLKELLK